MDSDERTNRESDIKVAKPFLQKLQLTKKTYFKR